MKEIEGYQRYLISEEGLIYSYTKSSLGKLLKPNIDSDGYLRVKLTHNKQPRGFSVHRLVAITYIPNPLNLPEVNHLDGDKSNNRVSNLEWVDNISNSNHRIALGIGNMGTKRTDNTSGYVGVYIDKRYGNYVANICVNTKTIRLGSFTCIDEAALAYNRASLLYHINDYGEHIGKLNILA